MFIKEYIKDSILTKQKILNDETFLENIKKAADLIVKTYKNEKKVLIAGNGGSASDAQHIACELVAKFYFNRPGLCAFALSTDTSILSAVSNDYGFEHCFSRQIEANGKSGDVFIAISTSGNSKNIINAIEEAKNKGMSVIGLCGGKKCFMDDLCDINLKVPSCDTPKIQEAHIMIAHIICAMVEEKLFKNPQ